MNVQLAWEKIESWLREFAPASHAELPDPASSEAIRSLQFGPGLSVPDELADSLARHDGSGDFLLPMGYRLDSVSQIARAYKRYAEFERSARREAEENHRYRPHQFPALHPEYVVYWDPYWIPVAHDESGNCLFLSQEPENSQRKMGAKDKDGNGALLEDAAHASLASFLSETANSLRAGVARFGSASWSAVVDDGGNLRWEPTDEDDEAQWDMEELRGCLTW